jgi:hypothetical protein
MSNDDRLDISEIIDLERYPIGELDACGSRVVGRWPPGGPATPAAIEAAQPNPR